MALRKKWVALIFIECLPGWRSEKMHVSAAPSVPHSLTSLLCDRIGQPVGSCLFVSTLNKRVSFA